MTTGFEPRESGLRAHCHRVSALASEIGNAAGVPSAAVVSLEQAALLHHYRTPKADGGMSSRLLADVMGSIRTATAAPGLPDRVLGILDCFDSLDRADHDTRLLSEILDFSNVLDEQLEAAPLFDETCEDALGRFLASAESGVWQRAVLGAFRRLPHASVEEVVGSARRLPPFATNALRKLALRPASELTAAELERIAGEDQVFAASVLRVANSAFYSPAKPFAALRPAIAYIGVETAHRALLASIFRQLHASSTLKSLWQHSLRVAEITRQLAEASRRFDAAEAYVAGLVHDVGVLAFEKLGGEPAALRARLMEKGCGAIWTEMIVCGRDHAGVGAEILNRWNFPARLTEGVRLHHCPERAPADQAALPALLYLAEFWEASEEDLPSCVRLNRALETTGMSLETMRHALEGAGASPLDALAIPA